MFLGGAADAELWQSRVSWLFMVKVQRLQYGVDRIEDGGVSSLQTLCDLCVSDPWNQT